jgi:hypothetical protein
MQGQPYRCLYLVFSLEFGATFISNRTRRVQFPSDVTRRAMVIAVDGDFFYGMSFALH